MERRAAMDQDLPGLLNRRYSCRAFLSEPVPHELIRTLLEMAQRAPSWCNSQPWGVIVTEGEETESFRKALRSSIEEDGPDPTDFQFPSEYVGIYKERQRECGWQLYHSLGITKGDREASRMQVLENFSLFGAPHVAIITSEGKLGTYGVLDCGSYINTFMLAATHLGLGCIAQAALAQKSQFIRDYFKVPAERRVVCGISFGYADHQHPANSFRTRREDIDSVVTFVGLR